MLGLAAWYRRWRRKEIPISDALWERTLDQIPYCRYLPPAQRAALRRLVGQFLAQKTFEAAGNQVLNDALCVQIAFQACVPILNLGLDYYDGWSAIIVYPGDFRVQHHVTDEIGVVHELDEYRSGESWLRGPVILSWDAITHGAQDGAHVVLHEFAHKIDMLNGEADGFPPLHSDMDAEAWSRDLESAYQHLCAQVDAGLPTTIDPYASESPAEFFAVVSEVFFMAPRVVADEYPAVYRQLRTFYRQDPLAVLGRAA